LYDKSDYRTATYFLTINLMTEGLVKGIYEVCLGVREAVSAFQYWEQFGYRIGQVGELSAAAAEKLYGVNSALQSIRLYHKNADHGLIRLMVWQKPTNEGLGMGSMKVRGNRWATTLTADLLNILNQVEEAAKAELPIKYTNPHWEIIYNKERKSRPFIDPAMGVREMLVLQPLTRQVLFQRFGYTLPHYGQIDKNSAFKTSQFTHMGMVIQDDSKETLKFYEEVLGLLRVRDDVETSYESSLAGREFFDLKPGEKFFLTAFDDPRSSKTDFLAVRSGRLYIIRFPNSLKLASQFERAKPGCLGMCLYTYRVGSLGVYGDRLRAGQAQNITDIVGNEFGEKSLSFVAPDGYFWTLLEG
jgi:catechol 2,3-dioxygenase-like lactoylglutathione lyase family enzyme